MFNPRLIGRFTDAPIAIKVFAAPVVIVLFMLTMAGAAQYSSRQQTRALGELSDKAIGKFLAADRAIEAAAFVHLNLYRAVSWATNSSEADKISASVRGVQENLAKAAGILDGFAPRWALAADEKRVIDAAKTSFADYRKAVDDVVEMVASDPPTALLFMHDAETAFEATAKQLDALRGQQVDRAGRMAIDAVAAGRAAETTLLVLLAVALLLTVAITVAISRAIARPLVRITGVMAALAADDTAVRIPDVERRDEIGRMAKAVRVFSQKMIRADELALEAAKARAQRETRAQRLEEHAQDFRSRVGAKMTASGETCDELQQSAQAMEVAANEAAREVTIVGEATADTSRNIDAVAAAIGELSRSVTEISGSVGRSTAIVSTTVDDALRATQTVDDLATAVLKIEAIVKLIDGIAERTNMLALNATIESARAGEAGRGFAVVAGEVKALANQTTDATRTIARYITEIQASTQRSGSAIQTIRAGILGISEISAAIAAAVEQQDVAAAEISSRVRQASHGTSAASEKAVALDRSARGTGRAAMEVMNCAQEMSARNTTLRADIEDFLGVVKAA